MADIVLCRLPLNQLVTTISLTALPIAPTTLFCFSLSNFVLVSVFGRVENIYGKFQEYSPLEDSRDVDIKLRRKRDKNARSLRVL